MPLAVQLSVLRSASTSVDRVSLPPSATAFSTNSRAADQENTPKKVGDAPGLHLLEPAQVELHLLVGAGLLERHEVQEDHGAVDGVAAGADEVGDVVGGVAQVDVRLVADLLHGLRQPHRLLVGADPEDDLRRPCP